MTDDDRLWQISPFPPMLVRSAGCITSSRMSSQPQPLSMFSSSYPHAAHAPKCVKKWLRAAGSLKPEVFRAFGNVDVKLKDSEKEACLKMLRTAAWRGYPVACFAHLHAQVYTHTCTSFGLNTTLTALATFHQKQASHTQWQIVAASFSVTCSRP